MWKYSLMIGIAFDGSEELMVLLTTTSMPIATMPTFRRCIGICISCVPKYFTYLIKSGIHLTNCRDFQDLHLSKI
jgi:hypothetical protein